MLKNVFNTLLALAILATLLLTLHWSFLGVLESPKAAVSVVVFIMAAMCTCIWFLVAWLVWDEHRSAKLDPAMLSYTATSTTEINQCPCRHAAVTPRNGHCPQCGRLLVDRRTT